MGDDAVIIGVNRARLRFLHLMRHPKDTAKSYSRFNALRGWTRKPTTTQKEDAMNNTTTTDASDSPGSVLDQRRPVRASFSETVLTQLKGICTRIKSDVTYFDTLEAQHPGSVLRIT